ncbi:MAG: signal peptidase I [Siphonobacter aquaeclarae]|nr:signal peptidase I [Siphonobacter aquaeclarae]
MFSRKKTRRSHVREWFHSLAFAVVAATLIRFLTLEAFAIPTPSMEHSLMVGDFLFVSKLHYGIRTPQTPLQVPLTHQKIWGTNIPSYTDLIQLPTYRLPGFTHVRSGDVVVFNFPPPKPGEPDYPMDLRTYLIKRCIGTPGDIVEIRREHVFVNGKEMAPPAGAQTSYLLRTTEELDDRFFRKYGIVNDFASKEGPFINWQPVEEQDSTGAVHKIGYQILTTREVADYLKSQDWVQRLEPMTEEPGRAEPGIYGTPAYAWNRDNFGPLLVPKKGMTIPVNAQTMAVYGPVIRRYEHQKDVEVSGNRLKINGKDLVSYTFTQDYYFMMGDNRHNSDDSRYWGFVPEDHVVGKAVFVWMSLDPVPGDSWHTVRWSRLFRPIR